MQLEGSCHCRAVRFTVEAMSPLPFMHCHCSICRKTAGSGGYGINLGASMPTLKVRGARHLGTYHAVMREPNKRSTRSKAERRFCLKCGSPLWLWDPRWPELVHPHASAIDTPLRKPPEVVEADLHDAPSWVDVPTGKGHRHEERWPEESLEDWHRRHGLLGRVAAPGKRPMPMSPDGDADGRMPGAGEEICPRCGGSGRAGGGTCRSCHGIGKVNVGIGDA